MSDLLQKVISKFNATPHISGEGWFDALCPFHDDHNPSLVFNEEMFICYACGKEGTLEELNRRVETLAVVGGID
jgi:DNA primase